jgi:hypothetical protein
VLVNFTTPIVRIIFAYWEVSPVKDSAKPQVPEPWGFAL